jgi:transposase
MASAYSDDLREKFYRAYQRGDGSVAVLAERFGVSESWGEGLLRTVRRTGSTVRPAGKPRGPRSKLTPERQRQLRGWITQQPDLTLMELQQKLREQTGIYSSLSRLWEVLGALGLRLKKSHSTPPNKTRSPARSGAFSGARKSARSIRKS